MSAVALDAALLDLAHAPLAEQQQAVQMMLALEEAGALTETSLDLTDPDLPFARYEALGGLLGAVKRRSSWWIGDWLNFGEGVYGEAFAQAVAATGLNEQTLLHYQFVCRQVPNSRRYADLAFGVHALVARLEPREQTGWLRKASRKGWGEKELREAMKAKRSETQPQLIPDGEEGTDRTAVVEVAKAIIRDAVAYVDGQHYLVPNEDIARLRAALGNE